MKTEKKTRRFELGFTIMELLIATAVFGAVLLILTTGVLQFTHYYYKGITDNSVQQTARSVADQVAQDVQFGGGYIGSTGSTTNADSGQDANGHSYSTTGYSNKSYGYCVGGQLYSYLLGAELTDTTPRPAANPPATTTDQTNHSLVVSNNTGCTSGSAPQDLSGTASGTELLSPSMRLTAFDITQVQGSTNLYTIHVAVAEGDDDLLCNIGNTVTTPTVTNDCQSMATSTQLLTADNNPPSSDPTPDIDLACKSFSGSQYCAVSDITITVVKRVQ